MNTNLLVPNNKNKPLLIPKRVTIETVFGCNAHCIMCPVNQPSQRKKGVMPVQLFNNLIDSLIPYRKHFEMMDLYCLGEPMLDPYIFDRIVYVKSRGFRNVAISTNADLLDKEKQRRLLESGIDTVLFSLDGVNKETHERIRPGVNYERVLDHCLSIISMRNSGNYPTRFVMRFIRQDSNRAEWEDYKRFWSERISREKRDFITTYDVHSWGGQVSAKNDVLHSGCRNSELEKKPCDVIFDILYVLSDGSVPLCHEDWLHPIYNFGNISKQPAIQIFNSEAFNRIRTMHMTGKKNKLDICRECTVLYSQATKEIV